jgi:hypothetical protein
MTSQLHPPCLLLSYRGEDSRLQLCCLRSLIPLSSRHFSAVLENLHCSLLTGIAYLPFVFFILHWIARTLLFHWMSPLLWLAILTMLLLMIWSSTDDLVFYFLPLSIAAAILIHGRYDVVSTPSSAVSRGGNTIFIRRQLCWQLPLLSVLFRQFSAFLNPDLWSQYVSWLPTSLAFRCYFSGLLICAAQKVWIPFRISSTSYWRCPRFPYRHLQI